MRVYIRNQITDLLSTLMEGGKYIGIASTQNAKSVAEDCETALNSIEQSLKDGLTDKRFSEYHKVILGAKKSMRQAIEKKINSDNISKEIREFNKSLTELENNLKKEAEVKLEILFLPYKYSMWDSLESIWLTAKDDQNCNSNVMPIPYYERDTQGLLKKNIYEGDYFLNDDIPIVSYKEYDISKQRPDIIYFHNPYDGNNHITSVSPEFYTDRLKHYTDMLVYVPYFIAGAYRSAEDAAGKCLTSGVLNASKVILQSEVLKEVYIKNGINPEKLVALGSPKIDSILKISQDTEIPFEWKQRIKGKKVILLNSSLGRLLNSADYINDLTITMESILSNENTILLWRPHPLMESAILSMRPEFFNAFINLKERILENENAILDEKENAASAIVASHAMISDGSSLIRTYIMTGKPILVMESSKTIKGKALLSCDIYSSYFYNDGVKVEDFLEMLSDNKDPNREIRISNFIKSMYNTDGSCGKKIHQHVTKEVSK